MTKRRVLVVDDEPDILRLWKLYLELEGWTVLTASRGEAALEIAKKEQPEAIFLDYMMPGLDGPAVCRLLRVQSETANLPIILFSAKVGNLRVSDFLAIGFTGVLPKRFSTERLVKDICEILGWEE